MEIKVSDWLQAADHEVEMRRWRDQSHGRWKQFTVECTFEGVTPDLIRWYYMNFDVESYRLWHPSHIGLQWEKKIPGPGAIHIAWEMIGGKLAAYRIRADSSVGAPASLDVPKDGLLLSILDTEGDTLQNLVTQYIPTDTGTIKRSRFVFPEAAPDGFCEAHRQHWLEEQPGMAYKAIPYLIQKTFGYMATPQHVLKQHPFVPVLD